MSFLQRDTSKVCTYSSPFCASTTYCNQDVHIGVEVGQRGRVGRGIRALQGRGGGAAYTALQRLSAALPRLTTPAAPALPRPLLPAPYPQNILQPSNKRFRSTKIVATVGPATRDAVAMAALVEAGVNVARFNVKHNTEVGTRGAGHARAGGPGVMWFHGLARVTICRASPARPTASGDPAPMSPPAGGEPAAAGHVAHRGEGRRARPEQGAGPQQRAGG
jgi:hypothetical protein